MLEEEADEDIQTAIKSYRAAVAQFDQQRPAIANAIFRLGECYRKLGRIPEAKTQVARILREFPDQKRLAELSQKQLFEEPAQAEGNERGKSIDH